MLNNYVQIQMSNMNNYQNIQWLIQNSSISPEEPAVLLVDEIQKFRTVNEDRKQSDSSNYQGDLWELLSDGKFSYSTQKKQSIIWVIRDIMDQIQGDDNKRQAKRTKSKNPTVSNKNPEKISM